jgi:hypothetical protein
MRGVRWFSALVTPLLGVCLACGTAPRGASGLAGAPTSGGSTMLTPAASAAPDPLPGPDAPAVLPAVPSPAAFEPTSTSAPSAAGAGVSRGSRPSPIQTLNQMLTTQALLVSLLLAPLGKEAAPAPLARLDEPAP